MLLAHSLGILGEFLNLIGAIFLAIELFRKHQYREEDSKNAELHDFALRNGLNSTIYSKIRVADSGFAEKVAEQRAKNLGFRGALLLSLGFGLLVAYHIIEMFCR